MKKIKKNKINKKFEHCHYIDDPLSLVIKNTTESIKMNSRNPSSGASSKANVSNYMKSSIDIATLTFNEENIYSNAEHDILSIDTEEVDLTRFKVRTGKNSVDPSLRFHNESSKANVSNYMKSSIDIAPLPFKEENIYSNAEHDILSIDTEEVDLTRFKVRTGKNSVDPSLRFHNESSKANTANYMKSSIDIATLPFINEENIYSNVEHDTEEVDLTRFKVRTGKNSVDPSLRFHNESSKANAINYSNEINPQNQKRDIKQIDSNNKSRPAKPSEYELTNYLLLNYRFVKDKEGNLYYWNSVKKIYESLAEDFNIKIRKMFPTEYKKYIRKQTISEIQDWLHSNESITSVTELILDKYNIYFKDCIFNVTTLKTNEFKKKYFVTHKLNINYPRKKNNLVGKNFEKFMDQVTSSNKFFYLRIQELLGYLISEIRDIKYIPILIGPKDTGKSVFLNLIENIIGEENCTAYSIEQLNKQEYLTHIQNKKVNICAEISELKVKNLDTLKKLSGNDKISSRALYSDPVSFRNKAALLFAGNSLPNIDFKKESTAFLERILIFPFTNQVPKELQDTHLLDRLNQEIPYIANWAIEGLKRLIGNNYIFTSDPYSEAFFISSTKSSIELFSNEYILLDEESAEYRCDIYRSYCLFCSIKNIPPIGKNKFYESFEQFHNVIPERFRQPNKNDYGYKGVKLYEK